MRVISEQACSQKTVFLRVDFNIAFEPNNRPKDDFRIAAASSTVDFLLKYKARLLIATHLGEPTAYEDTLSTKRLLPLLKDLIPAPVVHASHFDFPKLNQSLQQLKEGEALLLENLRFHQGEVSNDEKFAQALASLAQVYVNDAFGTVHRAHASIVGVPKFLPSYAGFLLQREVEALSTVFHEPRRPLVFIVGGGKPTTKAKFLAKIAKAADYILVGGVLANIFLKAQGQRIGRSVADEESIALVQNLPFKPDQLVLPEDFVVADELQKNASTRIVDTAQIEEDEFFVDIGPKSLQKFARVIAEAQTIVWNGPLGYYEIPKFAQGTYAVGELVASSHATKVIGGGDLTAALRELIAEGKFDHVSTGGGAMIQFLSGERLPGLEALGYYNS